jgi:2-C-methyl-D-erythritol 4-phosphate cytidylyltransferase
VAGATAIRGSQNATVGAQTPQQFSYAKLAQAYADNPNVEASWPAELRDAFWKETNARGAG